MTDLLEELVIRKIRIDEDADRGDSDSQMMCFEVIMLLKIPINYDKPYCWMHFIVSTGKYWKQMTGIYKGKMVDWSLMIPIHSNLVAVETLLIVIKP